MEAPLSAFHTPHHLRVHIGDDLPRVMHPEMLHHWLDRTALDTAQQSLTVHYHSVNGDPRAYSLTVRRAR